MSAVTKTVIPSVTVLSLKPREKGPLVGVQGDDLDGGCRTICVGDVLAVPEKVPPEMWEVDWVDHRGRQIGLIPFRHQTPAALDWKPAGYRLSVVRRGYQTPDFTRRRAYARSLAMLAMKDEPLAG